MMMSPATALEIRVFRSVIEETVYVAPDVFSEKTKTSSKENNEGYPPA